jgi:serine/threonine-protein kinase
MWQLTLFGGFGLEGAQSLTGRAAQRKRQALLALLGSGPHPQVSRDKIVALLWPETDGERARHLLASSVYDLRQVLGDDAILASGDDLRLNPERVRSDVREFDAALERRDITAATSLRTGPFLDGFHVTGAPEFERWVDGERDRLEQRLAHAVERLAEECTAAGDYSGTARHLQTLVTQQPYNSRVALLYMQALDRAGDSAGAIRHARTHELLTQQELGIGADEQIAEYVAELRGRAGAQERVMQARETAIARTAAPALAPFPARTLVRWMLPIAAAAVVVVALLAIRTPVREPAASIAVLPFKSVGGDEENRYFADGIHEDLLTQLAKFPDLKVISRTSVMQYRDAQVNMREIGRALGVAVVLEGSVRRAGNQVRVVAQLIDAETDKHLWAETYDRELTDVFGIQSEIAQNIARVLHADLGGQKASNVTAPTAVSEAYDLYLQARNLIYATPVQHIDYPSALALLERAVQLDPKFAFAYGELARLHAGMVWTNLDGSNARAAAAAQALDQAVGLRPDAPETRIAAGYYYYWARRDYRRALHELEQARAQLPGSAEVLHVMGLIQRRIGEIPYAIESFSSAAQRDPARSLSFTYLGESLAALGRFAEADRAYQNALARLPTDPYTLRTYGDMHVAWRGSIDTLRAAVARMPENSGPLGGLPAARFRLAMFERDCAAAAAAVKGAPELIGLQHSIRPRALYSAWAAECAGQQARARVFYREAERVARAALAREGAHPALHVVLGQALAGQNRMTEAVAAGRRAIELIPYDNDAVFGGYIAIEMAALYTRAQQHERALSLLEKYCGQPFGIWPNELRLEPRWDPLRELPRFQALLRSSCRTAPS